jgi:hypothetical protein
MRERAILQARWIDANRTWVKLYVSEIRRLQNELHYKKKNKSNDHWLKTNVRVLTQPELRDGIRAKEAETRKKAANKGKGKGRRGRKKKAPTPGKENQPEGQGDSTGTMTRIDEQEDEVGDKSNSNEPGIEEEEVGQQAGDAADYVPNFRVAVTSSIAVRRSQRRQVPIDYTNMVEESVHEVEYGPESSERLPESVLPTPGRTLASRVAENESEQTESVVSISNSTPASVSEASTTTRIRATRSAHGQQAIGRQPLTRIYPRDLNRG